MKSYLLTIIISATLIGGKASAQTNSTATQSKNNQMKQFSLLIRVPVTYTSEQVKLANPLWEKTLQEWKSKGVYILSFAFPGESYTVSGSTKAVKKETIISNNLKVVSNIVLQAESMEQVIELAKECPILTYEGSVEIREIPKPLQVRSE